MISRAANRTSSERSSSTSLRPAISALSFSRVRSDAAILSIGVLLRGGRSTKPDLVGSPDQARVHPNPFSSKLRTSPVGRIYQPTFSEIDTYAKIAFARLTARRRQQRGTKESTRSEWEACTEILSFGRGLGGSRAAKGHSDCTRRLR
jgi:hypothetical protein